MLRAPEDLVREAEQDVRRLGCVGDRPARSPDPQPPEDMMIIGRPTRDLGLGLDRRHPGEPVHQVQEQRDRAGEAEAVIRDRRGSVVGARRLHIDVIVPGDLGLERAGEVEVLAEARDRIAKLRVGQVQ